MPFFFLVLSISFSLAISEADAQTQATPSSSAPPATAEAIKAMSVSRVVGEVGPRIVTSREVRMNEAVTQILSPDELRPTEKTPQASKKKIMKIDDPAFPALVLRVLDEWTVYLEAVEIGSTVLDKAEVGRLVKVVGETWKGHAEWEALDASPTELREIIERKLTAQSLEKLKGDASLVNVTDTEALQYYKKNRLRFGNLPFENFKDNIKSALVKSQTERRLSEWRAVLRRKYRVRNFVGA